jgi:hypothetical protein
LIIVVFYTLLSGDSDSKAKSYADKGEVVAEKLIQEGIVDPETGDFNSERFIELANEDYEGLKERLGIVGDFCLFVESTDQNPSLRIITNKTGDGWTGIGSGKLNISGYQCGQHIAQS